MDLNQLKKLFTVSNILKLIAVCVVGLGAIHFPTVASKASAPAGVPINDVLKMLMPALGGIATWFASTYFKVKPDLIQAVTAVIANPKDPLVDLRLAAVVVAYIREQWPEAPEAVALLSDGLKKLTDAVGNDLTKTTPAA